MKKKILIVVLLLLLIITIFYFNDNSNSKVVVNYNGSNLMISVDGASSTTLPTTGTYYLTNYDCDNSNTKIVWDSTSRELVVSNGKDGGGVSCDLTFKSNPLLSEMPVGSYVAYEGKGGTVGSTRVECQNDDSISSVVAETESPYSCLGKNASEGADTNGNTYGYCYSSSYKYYTTGWRIAYIDETNNKAVIISAGSPECNTRTSIAGNTTYIKTANALALKYCNTDFVDGDCTCTSTTSGMCDTASTDAWAISDNDFYNITKAISGVGKRLAYGSSSLGDSGGTLGSTKYCYNKNSYQECGYNNDLIDNGGYYWFAAQYTASNSYGVSWDPRYRNVNNITGTHAYGLRPVISLSSSVFVTGGSGTMDDPYTISNS